MAITVNENNHIQCTYHQLYFQGEFYLDWTALVEVSGQPSTNLYRIIKSLNDVPKITYKNRCYYLTSWCMRFWKIVGEQNR